MLAPDPLPLVVETKRGWMRFLCGRAVRLVTLLIGVSFGAFMLLLLSPVDPIQAYIGADINRISADQRAAIAQRWGLDLPPLARFASWASQAIQGDLGESLVFGKPVSVVIGERFGTSLALLATAWVLSGVLGFAMGVLAGRYRGGIADKVIIWWAYTLVSAPTFWVALVLLYVFAVSVPWAPLCCAVPVGVMAEDVTMAQRLAHLALPATALSLVGVAPVALHTRQAVIEALDSDQVAFARAQGERSWGLVAHRVVRHAAAPAIMLQFASLGELFGGSILAEQVFSYPGLGQATTTAAMQHDVPLLMGIVLFTTVFVFAGNVIGELLHAALDPRVQLEARS